MRSIAKSRRLISEYSRETKTWRERNSDIWNVAVLLYLSARVAEVTYLIYIPFCSQEFGNRKTAATASLHHVSLKTNEGTQEPDSYLEAIPLTLHVNITS